MSSGMLSYWLLLNERRRIIEARKIERRRIRDSVNPFELEETEFRQLFRISRVMAKDLIEKLTPFLQSKTTSGLPVYIKVLAPIRFLATGSYQRGTGQDHFLAIGQTTVSNCIRQFTKAVLENMYRAWIHFPGTDEARKKVESGFRDKLNFPHVLGCIGCTHIAIVTPSRHEETYKNHQGFYSLNVQMVCDASLKILNINTRFPGTVHDQLIWNNSILKTEMIRLYDERMDTYFLLGDSGYALEPYLMTPILNAVEGTAEHKYTKAHCKARCSIESLFGVLRAIFRCLSENKALHYEPRVARQIITTCAVLYNMMKHYKLTDDYYEDAFEEVGELLLNQNEDASGTVVAREMREKLVRKHFSDE